LAIFTSGSLVIPVRVFSSNALSTSTSAMASSPGALRPSAKEAQEAAAKAQREQEEAEAAAKAKADAEAKAKAEADAKAQREQEEAKAEAVEKAEAKEWEKAVEEAKAASAAAEKAKSDGDAGKASGEIGGGKTSGEIGARSRAESQGDRSGEVRAARATSNPDVVAGPKILVEDLVATRSEARSIAEAATAAAEAAAAAAKPAASAPTAPATDDPHPAKPESIAAKAKVDPAAPAQRATPTGSGRAKRKSTQPPMGRSAASKEADRAVIDAQAAVQAAHSHFSDDEEAFFQAGHAAHDQTGGSPADSFDDLDVGYQRVGFWDRLIGKKSTKPPPAKAAAKKPAPKKPGQKKR
jgi:hypothetical protein